VQVRYRAPRRVILWEPCICDRGSQLDLDFKSQRCLRVRSHRRPFFSRVNGNSFHRPSRWWRASVEPPYAAIKWLLHGMERYRRALFLFESRTVTQDRFSAWRVL
jgi:hypothetical protein